MESSQRVVRQRPKERLLDVLPRGPYPLADDDSNDGGREIAAAAPDAIPNIRVEHSIMFFIVSFASLPIAATSGTFGAMGECVFSRTSIHRLTETRPIRAILTHDVRSPSGRNRRTYTFRLMTTATTTTTLITLATLARAREERSRTGHSDLLAISRKHRTADARRSTNAVWMGFTHSYREWRNRWSTESESETSDTKLSPERPNTALSEMEPAGPAAPQQQRVEEALRAAYVAVVTAEGEVKLCVVVGLEGASVD